MALSESSPHRNEATPARSRSRTLISRGRSYSSKSVRGLNLRAKIEFPIAYSYTSRRRLYIMRRVFLRYTLCTRRRISSKLVSSVRGSWIPNEHGGKGGVAILGECIRRKFVLSSREHRSDSSIHPEDCSLMIVSSSLPRSVQQIDHKQLCPRMDNVFVRRIEFSLLSSSHSKFDIHIVLSTLRLIWKVMDPCDPPVSLISFKPPNNVNNHDS